MKGVVRSGILRLIRRTGYDLISATQAVGGAPPIREALSPPIREALSEWDFARMLPARFSQRFFVNGFPGAGNVILRHLSGALLHGARPRGEAQDNDYASPALAFLGSRHDRLKDILSRCCPEGWRGNCYFNIHRGGGVVDFVSSSSAEHFLYAGPFDLGVYLNAEHHASHELPTRAAYETYASYGYEILPVVRHPLDILVSLAGKSPLSLREEEEIRLAPDATRRRLERNAGRRAIHARLNDDRWLRLAALALTEFFRAQADLQEQWPALRFEDMLADPPAFVTSLCARLSVDASPDKIVRIAGDIGAAQLAPGHFLRPSAGKWRRSFTRARLDFLEGSGLFEAAGELGYPRPSSSDLLSGSGREPNGAQPQEQANGLRFLEFQPFAQTFDPGWVARNAGLDEVKFARAGAVRMFGSDQSVLHHFRERLVLAALNALQGTVAEEEAG